MMVHSIVCNSLRPGQFPAISRNAGNHRNDGKFHKSNQILNQNKRNIKKLCLGKISPQDTVTIKFFVDSRFSNMLHGKKRNPGNAGNQQKAFSIKKHPVLTVTRKLLKSNHLLMQVPFWL